MRLFDSVHRNQLIGCIVIFVLFLATLDCFGQEGVEWLSWEEAVEKSKEQQKKFFVDVYTKWCGWCKKMDKSTFQRPAIVEYLNENFYSIKFDAEQRQELKYKDRVHKYVRAGRRGYNTLALELTKGRLSYPTIVFLDENMEVIQPIPGFREAKEFEMIMTYFAGDYFKTTPWKTYMLTYEPLEKKMNKYSQSVNYKKN